MTTSAVMSPADILKFQNDLVRTGNFEPLGKMQKISIGPCAGYVPPANDPIIAKFGRFIELRDQPLPLAQSRDRSMLLIGSPLVNRRTGYVALPDLPDPNWTAPLPTKEEIEGVAVLKEIVDPATGKKKQIEVREFPKDSPRHEVRMIPQRLEDRAEGFLEGTDFLVFSPVLGITFQPEIAKRMVGDAWLIDCRHDPATHTHMALLVNRKTGEAHFFGGLFEIMGSSPNSTRSPRG
jgi:hypothetical protein